MERANLLSAGDDRTRRAAGLSPADVRRRFVDLEPGAPRDATPRRGDDDLNPGFLPPTALCPAAVLVPLVDRGDGMTVLLTQRTDHLSHHAGQIAFPGGRAEAEDADAVATALRETEEEIGLARTHVEPIGRLDHYVTRTGFTVTPVVGLVHPPFALTLDSNEVADAFEVPLEFILDPRNRERHGREFQGVVRHFFVYPYQDRYIWGATAGMLANLAERLTG
jgi:8-oxo-dGTP pyrophosphatase MutT (NUDIX family)